MANNAQEINTTTFSQIKKGNKKVFDDIFKQYYTKLTGYAFFFVKDKHISDEIVSDVFADLWIKRKKIEIKTDFGAYLYSSVKNRCISHLRKQKIKFTDINEIKESYTAECTPEQKIIKLEQKQKLNNAIDKIPPRSREVFILHRFEGMKYKQIADFLGISKNTVENHIVKAMKILRNYYKK